MIIFYVTYVGSFIIIIIIIIALHPLCWTLAAFSVSWSYAQSVGLLGRGSARRKASTYT
jgi:hypothetical protein